MTSSAFSDRVLDTAPTHLSAVPTPAAAIPAQSAPPVATVPSPTVSSTFVVVPLSGSIDVATDKFRHDLAPLLQRDATLVLDLRFMTFLGPETAQLLLSLRQTAHDTRAHLVLWRPHGHPQRILRMTGMDRLFDIKPHHWRPRAVAGAEIVA